MDVRCYRVLKLLGVDMFTMFMKLGLCLILFNQVWASLAACKTGQWYLHGIGTVRGLEAGCATTHTPYLVVLLPSKRRRAEQRSSVWFVCEYGNGRERVGLSCIACYLTGKEEFPTFLPSTWIASATKASSRVLAFSNIRATGKMRFWNGRKVMPWLHPSTFEILIAFCPTCLVVLWYWVIAWFRVGSGINIVKLVLPTVNPADSWVLHKICSYVNENRQDAYGRKLWNLNW